MKHGNQPGPIPSPSCAHEFLLPGSGQFDTCLGYMVNGSIDPMIHIQSQILQKFNFLGGFHHPEVSKPFITGMPFCIFHFLLKGIQQTVLNFIFCQRRFLFVPVLDCQFLRSKFAETPQPGLPQLRTERPDLSSWTFGSWIPTLPGNKLPDIIPRPE